MLKIFMVHYKDKGGVTQRVRARGISEDAVKKRFEVFYGKGNVEKVELL